jgi:hypothetical protein
MKIKNFQKNSENSFSETNLSEKLAYLAGVLRDGSLPTPYNNQYEIQVSQDNIIWLEKVKEMLHKLFPEKKLKVIKYGKQTPRIKIYFPSFDLAIYSKNNITKFFNEIGTLHPRHIERLNIMLERS